MIQRKVQQTRDKAINYMQNQNIKNFPTQNILQDAIITTQVLNNQMSQPPTLSNQWCCPPPLFSRRLGLKAWVHEHPGKIPTGPQSLTTHVPQCVQCGWSLFPPGNVVMRSKLNVKLTNIREIRCFISQSITVLELQIHFLFDNVSSSRLQMGLIKKSTGFSTVVIFSLLEDRLISLF